MFRAFRVWGSFGVRCYGLRVQNRPAVARVDGSSTLSLRLKSFESFGPISRKV